MSGRIPVDRTHGGNNPELLDFSASINPLGPPRAALKELSNAEELLTRYPDPFVRALCAKIAEYVGVSPDNIVAGNGSTQLIYLVARTLKPARPAVVIPTFSEITNGLVLTGAAPHPVLLQERDGFTISAAVLEAALQNGPDAIFLGRPNSPTGGLLDLDPLIGLIRECERRSCWCVLDEAFIDFAGEKQSAVRLAARSKRTIILRSMTKMFAIPGIRLGYLVAHKEVVNRFRDAIEPWSVSSLAEQIGIKCLDEAADFVRHSIAFTYSEREFMVGAIAQIKGFRPFRSAANFLMFRVDEHRPHQFGDNCRDAGLAVRDLSELPGAGPGLYRISIRRRHDNERLLGAMRAFATRQ